MKRIVLNIILWPFIILIIYLAIKVTFLPSQENWSAQSEDMEELW